METGYKIIYAGHLRSDVDEDQFVRFFSERFEVSAAKARQLVNANREVLIKGGLSKDRADKYCNTLEELGMVVRVESAAGAASAAPAASEPDAGKATFGVSEPSAGRAAEAQDGSASSAADPYAAPHADLATEPEDGEMSGPGSVPVGHGWMWLSQGFWHFRQNPFQWIIALVLWVVLAVVVSLVPLLGSLAVMLFSPVVAAGFMIGANAQNEGGDFEVGHLFSGFSAGIGQLVLVGLLYLVGSIVLGILAAVLVGGGMLATLGGMEGMQQMNPDQVNPVMLSSAILIPMLIILALSIPLMMAYWFAPALVALEGLSAISAMKMSFVGCIKNMLPFLIYGLIGLVLVIVGSIPFMLGLLVVMPMVTASIFVAYKDIYYAQAA